MHESHAFLVQEVATGQQKASPVIQRGCVCVGGEGNPVHVCHLSPLNSHPDSGL